MKKIWNIEAFPALSVAAMAGSLATAYLFAHLGSYLPLFFPVYATAGDQLLRRTTTYQTREGQSGSNFFSYVPRIGFSLMALTFYALSLWVTLIPKDRGYQFPFDLFTKLSVLSLAVFYVALGSTLGRVAPARTWFNPSWINASKLAFKKTNRVLGWFFVLAGLTTIGIDLMSPAAAGLFLVCIGTLGYLSIWLGYSYLVWKHDPHRTPLPVKP
jgi:hypothetical protein